MRRAAGFILLVTGCTAAAPEPGADDVAGPEAVRVRVRRVSPRAVQRTERRTARVEARREVRLAFGVPGRIEKIAVDEGDRVEAGASLAAIDTRALRAQVAQARAALAEAERERARAKGLAEQAAIPGQRLDRLETQLAMAEAGVEAALAQLAQARIRAPFAADVVARVAEPGAWANPGQPILALAELDPARVVAQVPDEVRPRLAPGAAVEVTARGLDTPRGGAVVRVSPMVDPKTGLFRVEIDVPNPDRRLAAGQPVEVAIEADVLEDVAVLAPEWVVYRPEGPAVVTVEGGRAQPVRLGANAPRVEGGFAVDAARLAGRPIVVEGQSMVEDGAPVRVIDGEAAPVAEGGR